MYFPTQIINPPKKNKDSQTELKKKTEKEKSSPRNEIKKKGKITFTNFDERKIYFQ